MQTRTYGDLFKLVQSLAGVTAFSSNEQDDIANLINKNFQTAYGSSQIWPRYLIPSQKRRVAAVTLSGLTGNLEKYNGNYFFLGTQSQGGGQSAGNVASGERNSVYVGSSELSPAKLFRNYSSATSWSWILGEPNIDFNTDGSIVIPTNSFVTYLSDNSGDFNSENPWDVVSWLDPVAGDTAPLNVQEATVIPYSEYGRETIGEFIRIHKQIAFDRNSAQEYEFFVNENGGNVINGIVNEFSFENAGDGYTEFRNNLYVTYKKVFTPFTTSSSYATSTEEVPEEFFAFIAHSSYADFLRMDGQHQKAMAEETKSMDALDLQLERNDIISNSNNLTRKFSTYVNRQSR